MNVVEKLEDAVGRVVICKDGSVRRVLAVTDTHVQYSIPVTDEMWVELTPTARRHIELDIVGAPYE